MTCVNKTYIVTAWRHLAKKAEIERNIDKDVRIKIWDIPDQAIIDMFGNFQKGDIASESTRIDSKLKKAMDIRKKFQPAIQEFIAKLQKVQHHLEPEERQDSAKGARHQAIALQVIMDSVKAEIDKANNESVELTKISNDGFVPYIPLHRLAATIGRKILYLEGFRVTKEGKGTPTDVEHSYYRVGMQAIDNLADNDFIKIHPTGRGSIKDFLDDIDEKRDYNKKVVTDLPVLEIQMSEFGVKKTKNGIPDPALQHFTNPASADIDNHLLKAYLDAIKAVNLLSVPETIILPETSPITERKNQDVYTLPSEVEAARKELESHPTHMDAELHVFFKMLHEKLKDSGESASRWITGRLDQDDTLRNLFKIERNNLVAADEASFAGRNLSKTTPLDDLIEYYDRFMDENGDSKDLYMAMFAGRNVRLYIENSVLNPQASKLMRHALSVKPYEMETGSDVYNYYLNKVAIRLGFDEPSALLDINETTQEGKDLAKALKWYDKFTSSESVALKLAALSHIQGVFPGLDFTDLITTVGAVKGIRDAIGKKTLTSSYMVNSDATASGGQIILKQALGSNPGAIKKLMQRLNLFKTDADTKDSLNDIYAILQKQLELFIDDEIDEDGFFLSDSEQNENMREIADLVKNTLFDNIREMAKPSTMTFIYQQSKVGARKELSKTFREKLIDNINQRTVSDDTIRLANLLLQPPVDYENNQAGRDALRDDPNIRTKLDEAFAESGLPDFMYNALTHSLVDLYLDNYKVLGKRVFDILEGNPLLKDMKMFTTAEVVQSEVNGETLDYSPKTLKESGIPLSKVFEVQHQKGNDAVLTREEKLQSTVLGVSATGHNVDASTAYRGVKGLPTKHDTGMIIVHDDLRTSAPALMEAETQYIQEDYNAAYHFDVYEQALLAAAAYDPSLKSTAEYTKLLEQVRSEKAVKQEILEDSYDFETRNIIGDKAHPASITKPRTTRKKTFKEKAKNDPLDVLADLAPESKIISDFLATGLDKRSGVEFDADENISKFETKTDTIKISDKDTRTDSKTQSLNTKSGRSNIATLIEHEIIHSYTAGLITDWAQNRIQRTSTVSPAQDLNFAYVNKVMTQLRSRRDKGKLVLSDSAMDRLDYALDQGSIEAQMSEFIAIMTTEPDVAKSIYNAIGGEKTKLRRVLDLVIAKVTELISTVTYSDVVSETIQSDKLFTAINSTVENGQSARETNVANIKAMQTYFGEDLFAGPSPAEESSNPINYINAAIARNINDPLLSKGDNVLSTLDGYLKVNFPTYLKAVKKLRGIYNDSTELQGLVQKITNAGVDTGIKNKVQSLAAALRSDRENLASSELQKYHALKLSESEQKAFYDFTHKMALQDYFMFAEDVTDLDSEIALVAENFDDHQIRGLESIVKLNVDGIVNDGTAYNVQALGFGPGDLQNFARKLVVLKSIKAIGHDKFKEMAKNKELMELAKDTVMANELIMTSEANLTNEQVRDSQTTDRYKEPVVTRVIRFDQVNTYALTELSGWKILVAPTKTSLGVVYQHVIDSTYQEGAFTDIRMNSGDINVPKSFRGDPNVIRVGEKYKYILTQKDKETMGLIKDGAQGIVQTMSHNMAIKDSNGLRDLLLEEGTYWNLKKKDVDNLRALIKDPDRDHPWFLGGDDTVNFNDLPGVVKSRYMPIEATNKRLSDSGGFDKKIQYVRKDISFWLVGLNEQSLVKDPKLKWALRITKDLVAGAKIGLVILNPVKIAADNMSNVSYLSVRGVDPLFIQRNYRQISAEFNSFKKLKNELTQLRVRKYARPDDKKLQNRIATLEKQITTHPSNGLVERGFINSLGSDLILNTNDAASGFKSDIDKVLTAVFKDNKGKNNEVGKFIMNFSRWNTGLEEFLETLSPVFGALESTATVESELNRIGKRLKNIKNEDDLVSYLHQYLNSPDSEFVKLGTHMTDLTDILSKETLYRYLVENGVDPKEAEVDVIDSFPDYKEGLPLRIKQLSDVGIVPFPTYLIRIQKAILRLAKNKPVSFGTELAIEQYLEINAHNIWDAGIWNRFATHFGIFNTPWDWIGVGSLAPTHITG